MPELKHVKAVRTRYLNTLSKEIENGCVLLQLDLQVVDLSETKERIEMSLKRIKTYVSKLEAQSEKVIEQADIEKVDVFDEIEIEDSNISERSLDLCIRLEMFHDKVCKVKSEQKDVKIVKENTEIHEILDIQRQVLEQMTVSGARPKAETSVKLPKLEMIVFNGNRLRWTEFWQSFESSVHNNSGLSNIDKFNYLRSKLVGEARSSIAGLALSNENYPEAVTILKKRYGNVQETVDLHYSKIISLRPANDTVESLRSLTDAVDKHLRSLLALDQDINQDLIVSVLKSKLPCNVLKHLELTKRIDQKWTVELMQKLLSDYVTACERAGLAKKDYKPERKSDKHRNMASGFQKPYNNVTSGTTLPQSRITGTALNANALKGESKTKKCRFCANPHWSDECPRYKTIEDRKKCLKGSCYKCLRENHSSADCKSCRKCVYCNETNVHHRSLCPKKFKQRTRRENVQLVDEILEDEKEDMENVLLSSGQDVVMQTALVDVHNSDETDSTRVRVLLDSGSQRTYVSERLAKQLKLKSRAQQELKLATFGNDKCKTVKTSSAEMIIDTKDGKQLRITANIVPNITSGITRKAVKIEDKEKFGDLVAQLHLADTLPDRSKTEKIDMLIGNDYYLDIICGNKIEVQSGLYLLASKFGWILSGRSTTLRGYEDVCGENDVSMLIMNDGTNLSKTEVYSEIDECLSTSSDLDKMWKLDTIGIHEEMIDTSDEKALSLFKESLTFIDNRYYAAWPWKDTDIQIREDRPLAVGRLKSLVKRLDDKPDLTERYDAVIKDQLEKGVIEKVEKGELDGVCHYIPHHAVVKPDHATTKIRIVYDASAKTKMDHKSLNECLYRGPVLLQDLCGTLMRFRMHPIALISDIEKAFLQIGLQLDQRDVTRFLWLKDTQDLSASEYNIQEYRFTRVPFGVISSPFLLSATVDFHLSCYSSKVAEQIRQDIYMDNVITGVNSDQEAVEFYNEAKEMFKDASMNLREWASNSEHVTETIPESDRSSEQHMKVLGLVWDKKCDSLGLKDAKLNETKGATKRLVLKNVASVFDPLGLFSPVTLKGKLLLQGLWTKHCEWDEGIDSEDSVIWSDIIHDLKHISDHKVERCVVFNNSNGVTNMLVCFCDASAKAYAACVYFVQHGPCGNKSDLIFSKTRLAPSSKATTIPRLELMAAVIAIRCINFVKKQIRKEISAVYLISDSQCVLKWIFTDKTVSVFVKNRISEIKENKDIVFRWVPSEQNPADLASRGCSLDDLRQSSLWWNGPKWLCKSENEWCCSEIATRRETEDKELELVANEAHETNECESDKYKRKLDGLVGEKNPLNMDSGRYSSLLRMLRVTAWCLRFISRLKLKGSGQNYKEMPNIGRELQADEISDVERLWVKRVQTKHFRDVLTAIHENRKNSTQSQLGIFEDSDGLLRCKGRLENSCLTESAKYPILLPSDDRFTELLIEKIHKEILHSGVSQTLNALRFRYWVIRGRSTVKKVLRKCLVCRRMEGGPYKMPPMAPIPATRVNESCPFTKTGIDYLGPILVKDIVDVEPRKVWICLFTCMVTRAVHLEIVEDMSTPAFLNCLRRFVATRGKPDQIVCDNALQFKLASETTRLIWHEILASDDVLSYVSTQGIRWSFITELAPWMGGFYERLVGLVKRALRKTVGSKILSFDQIHTVVKEVEAVVNSRPLTYVGDDINSNIVIQPCHFLAMNTKTGIPCASEQEGDPDYKINEASTDRVVKMWKKGRKLVDQFWKIWRESYLTSLRERFQSKLKGKRITSDFVPTIGSVVLIKESLQRGSWRFGKVVNLVQSRDGLIRSAEVETSSKKVLRRPLCLLYPLEMCETMCEKVATCGNEYQSDKQGKPIRRAKLDAKRKLKEITC